MPLRKDKLQFKGLFACTTRKGCPESNLSPYGCPLWRDNEPWENPETQEISTVSGCGFAVDSMRERWTAGRAVFAANAVQQMRRRQDTVMAHFQQFFAVIREVMPQLDWNAVDSSDKQVSVLETEKPDA